MRRLVPTTIVLMTLLLAAVAAAPGVAGQDTAEHPAIGTWIIDTSPEDGSPPELAIVAPGGIIINAFPEGTAYGSWAATGDQTADATFVAPADDPEAGFLGFFTVRTSFEVAADGQSVAGTYTIEYPAPLRQAVSAPVGQYSPVEVTGQRVIVEPMGEPVGPIPEEPVEPPAPDETPQSAEASPVAPEESPAA
jgi:hypothetical protein